MNYNVIPAIDRQAAAVSEVKQMHDDLTDAQAVILQLKADLHRGEDRVVMLVEQCDRHRHAELKLRKLLNELTTQMSNISLLAKKAEDFVREIDDMDEAPTPPTAAIDLLASEFKEGSK